MSDTPARDRLHEIVTWHQGQWGSDAPEADAEKLIDAFAREERMSHVAALGDTTARGNLLNVMARWFLTPGCGSREIADRILAQHAHELAEKIRTQHGTVYEDAGQKVASGMLRAADLIDPEVTR